MSDEVDKIIEKVNSQEFKDQQASLITKTIKDAVEVQPIAQEDATEARKGGKVHGDPFFICGR